MRGGAALRRDPWLLALAALALVQYALLAPRLVYPDVGLDYPFRGGDSFDWLTNALALLGEDVRYTFRPPVLPLVLALLSHLGLLSLFPPLGLAFHHAAAVGAHLALRRRFGGAAAFTCGLFWLTNVSLLLLALQVMADLPAAILLGASCAAFLAAGRRRGLYLAAGALAGLSAVTQEAALLLPLPMAVTVLAVRRRDLRSAYLWGGAALFGAFPAAWLVTKRLAAGTFLDAGVRHWGLLGFQPENAPHYLVAGLSFWGWPALALTCAGAVASVRALARRRAEADRDADAAAWALLPLLTTVVVLVFFALFYDFLAKRFLVYAFVPALALLARALSGLRGTRALAPAALLTVAIGAWPLPNPELANRATLWPLPTVDLFVPTGHAARNPLPRFASARLEVRDLGAALRRDLRGRILRQGPGARRSRAKDAVVPDGAEVVVYLAEPGPRAPSPHETITRLSYAMRRPVSHVSRSLYPDDWWGWRDAVPIGHIDRYRVFRLRISGAPEALVAIEQRSPTRRGRRRPAPGKGDLEPRPAPERLRRELELARGVARLHAESGGPLVVLPGARGEWVRLVPLVGPGTVQLPDGDKAAYAADLARREHFDAARVGPLTVLRKPEGRASALTLVAAGPPP